MHFKIWHLMTLTLLVAIAFAAAELTSCRTVTVRFKSPSPISLPQRPIVHYLPSSPDDDFVDISYPPSPAPTEYSVGFTASAGHTLSEGTIVSDFGYSSLLKQNVNIDNLSTFEGFTLTFRHRFRSLPWAPATEVEDEISKHFDKLCQSGNLQSGKVRM